MRRITAIFLLLACATASAEVFRQIEPDGSVSFSDTRSPGAEQVDLGPAQTISLPPVPQGAAGSERSDSNAEGNETSPPPVVSFAIAEPSDGQSVRANDGRVAVSLSLQPAPLTPGYTIELVVSGEDGEKVYSGVALSFQLSDLSRGEHSVVARLKNGRGEQVAETAPVTFYILRVALGG